MSSLQRQFRGWLTATAAATVLVGTTAGVGCAAPQAGEQSGSITQKMLAPEPMLVTDSDVDGVDEWRVYLANQDVIMTGYHDKKAVVGMITGLHPSRAGKMTLLTGINDGEGFQNVHHFARHTNEVSRAAKPATTALAQQMLSQMAKIRVAIREQVADPANAKCQLDLQAMLMASLQCVVTKSQQTTKACVAAAAAGQRAGAVCQSTSVPATTTNSTGTTTNKGTTNKGTTNKGTTNKGTTSKGTTSKGTSTKGTATGTKKDPKTVSNTEKKQDKLVVPKDVSPAAVAAETEKVVKDTNPNICASAGATCTCPAAGTCTVEFAPGSDPFGVKVTNPWGETTTTDPTNPCANAGATCTCTAESGCSIKFEPGLDPFKTLPNVEDPWKDVTPTIKDPTNPLELAPEVKPEGDTMIVTNPDNGDTKLAEAPALENAVFKEEEGSTPIVAENAVFKEEEGAQPIEPENAVFTPEKLEEAPMVQDAALPADEAVFTPDENEVIETRLTPIFVPTNRRRYEEDDGVAVPV